MVRVAESLYSFLIALWVGGMVAIGYLAAPVLFARIADRTLAGSIAGDMFAITAWIGLFCASYLVIFMLARKRLRALRNPVFWIVLLMAGLLVAGHFGVQPILVQLKQDALPRQVMESALRDRFATWHGISSGLFLLQSLLGVLLVSIQERGKSFG